MADDLLEISDVIVAFDPGTLQRIPVRKDDAVARFTARGNARAARIVRSVPDRDGVLDADAVDDLLLRVHCELQRISEEFDHGQRVAELLRPLLDALRASDDAPRPIRIVDVGCGPGYVLRWLAARGELGAGVELLGVDFNPALIARARQLADEESLKARFVVDNAFALSQPGTLFISTGVIHHFRGDGLIELFRQHEQPTCHGFVHFDFQPSTLSTFGAWLLHAARMREPLSRHDGVLSAARAHPASTLLDATRRGAPSFRSGIYGARIGWLPLRRAFHTLVGVRPALVEPLRRALGHRATRLEMS